MTEEAWAIVAPRVARCPEMAEPYAVLAIQQVHALLGAAGDAGFIAALGAYTCSTAARHQRIKLDALAEQGALARLLTPGAGTEPGRVVLAFLAALDDAHLELAKAFLLPLVTPFGFVEAVNTDGLLDVSSVLDLKRQIGAPVVIDPVSEDVVANFGADQERPNEGYASPLFARGRTLGSAPFRIVAPTAEAEGVPAGELGDGREVVICGRHIAGDRAWYVCERPGGLMYLASELVQLA